MAYKVSSGNRKLGDIIFEDDVDTGIDFAANKVALEAAGQERVVADANSVSLKAGNAAATNRVIANGNGVQVLGSYRVSITSKDDGDHPYTVAPTDHYIGVDTGNGAVTVNIPDITNTDQGRILVIFDAGGNAGNHYITISAHNSDNINNSQNTTIEAAGGSVTLLCTDMSSWMIINRL